MVKNEKIHLSTELTNGFTILEKNKKNDIKIIDDLCPHGPLVVGLEPPKQRSPTREEVNSNLQLCGSELSLTGTRPPEQTKLHKSKARLTSPSSMKHSSLYRSSVAEANKPPQELLLQQLLHQRLELLVPSPKWTLDIQLGLNEHKLNMPPNQK